MAEDKITAREYEGLVLLLDSTARQVLEPSDPWESCRAVHEGGWGDLLEEGPFETGGVYKAWMELTDVFDIGKAPVRAAHAALRDAAEQWLRHPPAVDPTFIKRWTERASQASHELVSRYGFIGPWPPSATERPAGVDLAEALAKAVPVTVDDFTRHYDYEVNLSGADEHGVRWGFRISTPWTFESSDLPRTLTNEDRSHVVHHQLVGSQLIRVEVGDDLMDPSFVFFGRALGSEARLSVRTDRVRTDGTRGNWWLSLPRLSWVLAKPASAHEIQSS